jgi:hypothetical protein
LAHVALGAPARETRTGDRLRAPIAFPALALAAALTAFLGVRLGNPWLLPLLEAAPAWAVMAHRLLRGRRAEAILLMWWWAACLGLSMTVLSAADPWGTATPAVAHGPAYFQEMRSWVRTGAGCESSPACFIPHHLGHAAAFVALAILTAGLAAIVMGAFLMNYMSYFVGSLAGSAVTPGMVVLLGWFPWSLVRIASFVVLGAVLAEPLLGRLTGRRMPAGRWRWIAAAAAGIVLDIALKAWLAPMWPAMMRPAVNG